MDHIPTELEIRHELGTILVKLGALPRDAFHERSLLSSRQQELRALLSAQPIEGADEIKKRWSEKAGTKNDARHDFDPAVLIVSPGEGGGSGG